MTDIVALSAPQVEAFLMALLRTGGFVASAPLLSHKSIPKSVKIGLSVALAIVLTPLLLSKLPAAPLHMAQLVGMGVQEIVTGVIVGFGFTLLFTGLQAAGELVGLQVGFALANMYDPASQRQIGVLAQFELILGMLVFFAIDGHHLMLRAFFDSYQVIPVAGMQFTASGMDELIRLSGAMFVIAIKVAAPVMGAIFLTETALGIVARTVPQMNVFIVGFPLKIAVGLFMVASALPLFSTVFGKLLYQLNGALDHVLSRLVVP